jgi:hypothetical protein
MFFNFFKKRSELVLNVKILISTESSFQIISHINPNNDKDMIMLALLFYARILRIVVSSTEKKKLCESFLIWHNVFKEKNYDENIIEIMLNTFGQLYYIPSIISTKTKEIKMKKIIGGNYYLDMGSININPLTKLVYQVFKFVWGQINSENKKKLIEAFSCLSAEFIEQGISFKTSNSPNEIVNNLFKL